jgi:hypothetical protein
VVDGPVSPELALVDDELRASAVATLPALQPFAFLDLPPPAASAGAAHRPPLALAAAAYAVEAIVHFVVFAVPVVAALAALVGLLAALR